MATMVYERVIRSFSVFMAPFIAITLSMPVTAAEHDPSFASRIRYALAESEPDNGRSASALFRVGLASEWSDVLSSMIEVDHVATGWQSDYNDGRRNHAKPTIPDVAGTEINQLHVSLSDGLNTLALGRQRLALDDGRFISGNRFWQNEQTFDSVRYQRELYSATQFQYAYLGKAHRIFGRDGERITRQDPIYGLTEGRQRGEHHHQTHLLHLRSRDWDYQDASLFYYHIENQDVAHDSNRTLGFRYQFEKRMYGVKPRLTVSAATQTQPTPRQPDTTSQHPSWPSSSARYGYYLMELQVGVPSAAFSARYERLGSRHNRAFITPLAALHDFQGWADTFNSVPNTGFVDRSLRVMWRHSPIKVDARYHWFASDVTAINLGQELDVDIIVKINRHHKFLVRYARYMASSGISQTHPDEQRLFLNYSVEY